MSKHRINVEDLPWRESGHGEKYLRRSKRLARAAGGTRLGCTLYEIPAGKRAWPFHYHTANEEALFVLHGSGTLRLGNDTVEIAEGDYVAFPASEEGAHQVRNLSSEPLRYLCFSTMREPDVTVYPDTGKLGIIAGSPPGGSPETRTLSLFLRRDADVDYWEGED